MHFSLQRVCILVLSLSTTCISPCPWTYLSSSFCLRLFSFYVSLLKELHHIFTPWEMANGLSKCFCRVFQRLQWSLFSATTFPIKHMLVFFFLFPHLWANQSVPTKDVDWQVDLWEILSCATSPTSPCHPTGEPRTRVRSRAPYQCRPFTVVDPFN